jgi:hypothetical protein
MIGVIGVVAVVSGCDLSPPEFVFNAALISDATTSGLICSGLLGLSDDDICESPLVGIVVMFPLPPPIGKLAVVGAFLAAINRGWRR